MIISPIELAESMSKYYYIANKKYEEKLKKLTTVLKEYYKNARVSRLFIKKVKKIKKIFKKPPSNALQL